MATGSGPKQQDLLVQKNHAQRTPAPCMATLKSLVLVLKSLAQIGPRLSHAQSTPAACMVTSKNLVLVLKSLAQSGPRLPPVAMALVLQSLALAISFCCSSKTRWRIWQGA